MVSGCYHISLLLLGVAVPHQSQSPFHQRHCLVLGMVQPGVHFRQAAGWSSPSTFARFYNLDAVITAWLKKASVKGKKGIYQLKIYQMKICHVTYVGRNSTVSTVTRGQLENQRLSLKPLPLIQHKSAQFILVTEQRKVTGTFLKDIRSFHDF